jgi:hypothetical protein
MENLWNKENLQKITKILEEKGIENWPKICVELKISKGNPAWHVKKAYYSTKATADSYDFEKSARYDKIRSVVVVENPWLGLPASQVLNNSHDPLPPDYLDIIFGSFIELDAEIARKILVLGL